MKRVLGPAFLLLLSIPTLAAEGEGQRITGTNGNFDFGAYLMVGRPGALKAADTDASFGLGYGFALGWHGFPYLAIQARSEPFLTGGGSQSSAFGLLTKVFPLGPVSPRLYGLAKVGFNSVRDYFDTDADEGLFGRHWGLGGGFEMPLSKPLSFWIEFDAQRETYTSVQTDDFESRALPKSQSRWVPALRVGVSASF